MVAERNGMRWLEVDAHAVAEARKSALHSRSSFSGASLCASLCASRCASRSASEAACALQAAGASGCAACVPEGSIVEGPAAASVAVRVAQA